MQAAEPYFAAVSATISLIPGVCLQQLLTNKELSRVERANLAAYGFCLVFLLREIRAHEEDGDRCGQRQSASGVRYHLSGETLDKLLQTFWWYAQDCFPDWDMRISSDGTMIQEHIHALLRRIMGKDASCLPFMLAMKRCVIRAVAKHNLQLAPQAAAPRHRVDSDVHIKAGPPTDAEMQGLIPLGDMFMGVWGLLQASRLQISGRVYDACIAKGIPVPDLFGRTECPILFLGNICRVDDPLPRGWVTTKRQLMSVTAGVFGAQNRAWMQASLLKSQTQPGEKKIRTKKVVETPVPHETPAAARAWSELDDFVRSLAARRF
jgi:hypothetical protein